MVGHQQRPPVGGIRSKPRTSARNQILPIGPATLRAHSIKPGSHFSRSEVAVVVTHGCSPRFSQTQLIGPSPVAELTNRFDRGKRPSSVDLSPRELPEARAIVARCLHPSAAPAAGPGWPARPMWRRRSCGPESTCASPSTRRAASGAPDHRGGQVFHDETRAARHAVVPAGRRSQKRPRGSTPRSAGARLLRAAGLAGEPEGFFTAPPTLTDVALTPETIRRQPLHRLTFDSGYQPHPGDPGRDRWLAYTANRREHALLLRHREPDPGWCACTAP